MENVVSDAVFSYKPADAAPTAWEAALGLRRTSNLARMSIARDGLPATVFGRFAEAIEVPREALARAIHVSVRTVQRRAEADERLDPGPSERLVRLADLYGQASEVVGDDTLARQWMQTPREAFGGRTPFELASSELGAREVEDLLASVPHGVFY